MRAYLLLALFCLLSVAALAQSGSAVPSTPTTNVPAPVATPDGPAAPTVPANPTPAPTTPTVTVTNPPTPVHSGGKRTPGRHCELRHGCGDCLAINYCVWSPSTNKCLDKHTATLKDDVVHTCDPDVCAKHGGRKRRDNRPRDHVAADIHNSRGPRVWASAEEVPHLNPHHAREFNPLPHITQESLGRTFSEDPHVVIKRGSRKYIFSSDNNSPIIRGEAEERRAQYLAEKREHARQVYRMKLCRLANGCGSEKPKKSFRSPEYYPVKNHRLEHRLLKADSHKFDALLRHRLEHLRERADYSLHHKSGVIAAKRSRLHDLLDQVSSAINRVNTEAAAIEHDAALYESLSKHIRKLEREVSWTCDAPNSAFLEVASEGETDTETEAENEQAEEAGAEAESEVDAEAEAEDQDFAAAEAEGTTDEATESEAENEGGMSAEDMEAAVSKLSVSAEYPNAIAV